jgi:hypothetical protein
VPLFLGSGGLGGRGSRTEPRQEREVTGEICDADGAHKQPHTVFLGGKDMLDARADPRRRGIGLGLLLRKAAPERLAKLDPLRSCLRMVMDERCAG